MPLSLNKLASFLLKKDFIPNKYFRYEGSCIFLEIVSLQTGVTSMIYVPSRFNIPISPGDNVIEIKLIDTDIDSETYKNNPVSSPTHRYEQLDVIPNNDNTDADELLQLKYKKQIDLKSGATEDTIMLKDIIRQLKRLQYCVEGLPYNLVVYCKGYLVYYRDSEPDCYIFNDRRRNYSRSLRIVTPLDLLYERSNSMDNETAQISSGIQNILDRNMVSHAKFLDQLISRKGSLLNFANLMRKKKGQYQKLLEKYKGLLAKLDDEEKKIKSERKKFGDLSSDTRFDRQLNRSQVNSNFERRIQHCLTVKQKVIDKIILIQTAAESLTLEADKILYDNSVMMDKIFKNFNTLINLSK